MPYLYHSEGINRNKNKEEQEVLFVFIFKTLSDIYATGRRNLHVFFVPVSKEVENLRTLKTIASLT